MRRNFIGLGYLLGNLITIPHFAHKALYSTYKFSVMVGRFSNPILNGEKDYGCLCVVFKEESEGGKRECHSGAANRSYYFKRNMSLHFLLRRRAN